MLVSGVGPGHCFPPSTKLFPWPFYRLLKIQRNPEQCCLEPQPWPLNSLSTSLKGKKALHGQTHLKKKNRKEINKKPYKFTYYKPRERSGHEGHCSLPIRQTSRIESIRKKRNLEELFA